MQIALIFIAGMIFGSISALILMCFCVMAKDDEPAERKPIATSIRCQKCGNEVKT
jgi:hypothetical protein